MKINVAFLLVALASPTIASRGLDVFSPTPSDPLGGGKSDLLFGRPIRYQQVYGASDFSAIGTGGGLITEIWFTANGGGWDGTMTNVQVHLSTTSRAVDGLSATFSQNIGPDETLVAAAPLHFSSLDGTTASFPFTSRIALTHPFAYNPSAGNLLLDIKDYAPLLQSPNPNNQSTLSSAGSATDTTSSVWFFGNADAITGGPSTGGFYTRFVVTPVPEPSTVSLFLIGAVTVGAFRSKGKSRNERRSL